MALFRFNRNQTKEDVNIKKDNSSEKSYVNYLIAGGGTGAMVGMTYIGMMDAYAMYSGKDDIKLNIILPEVDQLCTEAKMLKRTSEINMKLRAGLFRSSDTTVQSIQLADTMKSKGAQTYYSLDEPLFSKELFQPKRELDRPIDGFYRISTTAAMAAPLCNKKFISEIDNVCREIADASNNKAVRIGVVATTWGSEGQHFLNSAIPEIVKKTREILEKDKGVRGKEADSHLREHLETALFLVGPCNRFPTQRNLDDDIEARNIGFLQFMPEQLRNSVDKYFLFDHDNGTVSADDIILSNDQKKHFTALELDVAYTIFMYYSGVISRIDTQGNVITTLYGTPGNDKTDRNSMTLKSDMWRALDSRLRWDACLFYVIRPELGSETYKVEEDEWKNSSFVSTYYRRAKNITYIPDLDTIRSDIYKDYIQLIQREEDFAKMMRDIAFTRTKWDEQDNERVYIDRNNDTKLYSFDDIERLSPLNKTIQKLINENKLSEMNQPNYSYALDSLTTKIEGYNYDTRLTVREANARLKKRMGRNMSFLQVAIELFNICKVTGGKQ